MTDREERDESNITLEEIKLQKQIDEELQKASDDPAELSRRLQEKWGLKDDQELNQVIEPKKENTRLAELMAQRLKRKEPKLLQLMKQYDQMLEEEQVQKTPISRDEPMPKQIEDFMKRFPQQTGVINVGQEWANIVERGVQTNLLNQQKAYTNFYWHQIKRGRLGVDLFAIAFGICGIFIVPLFFWQKQYYKKRDLSEEIKMVSSVKDWENSELDIDDVSINDTYYTLFTDEIQNWLTKKLSIQQEINKLLGRDK